MKRTILYFTTEFLPDFGLPVAGGGIRAWGLGKGLESKGHKVIYSLPKEIVKQIPEPIRQSMNLDEYAHDPTNINYLLNRVAPDIVMFQQWPPASCLEETQIPVVIDLHGSLIIENAYRSIGNLRTNAITKMKTLQKADFFTTPSLRQKYYWWAWLMLSGVDPKELDIAVIPVSYSPELPIRRFENEQELTFIFGGISWAWQDVSTPLNTVIEVIEKYQKGILKIFTGKHPCHRVPGEYYPNLSTQLKPSKRVLVSSLIPHQELISQYLNAHVAIDLMKRNPERELAFTTRTIEYLWCGLPVIYGNYLELSELINRYQAGWIVDPNDPQAIREVIESIIKVPREKLIEYSKNAQRLVKEHFVWTKTIEPLDEFCQNPKIRSKKVTLLEDMINEIKRIERELERKNNELEMARAELARLSEELGRTSAELTRVSGDLQAIRNKALFKIYKRIKRLILGES